MCASFPMASQPDLQIDQAQQRRPLCRRIAAPHPLKSGIHKGKFDIVPFDHLRRREKLSECLLATAESNQRTSLDQSLSFSLKDFVWDDPLHRVAHHVAPPPRLGELSSRDSQKKVDQIPVQIRIAEFVSAKQAWLQMGQRIKNRLPRFAGKDLARKKPQPIADTDTIRFRHRKVFFSRPETQSGAMFRRRLEPK